MSVGSRKDRQHLAQSLRLVLIRRTAPVVTILWSLRASRRPHTDAAGISSPDGPSFVVIDKFQLMSLCYLSACIGNGDRNQQGIQQDWIEAGSIARTELSMHMIVFHLKLASFSGQTVMKCGGRRPVRPPKLPVNQLSAFRSPWPNPALTDQQTATRNHTDHRQQNCGPYEPDAHIADL